MRLLPSYLWELVIVNNNRNPEREAKVLIMQDDMLTPALTTIIVVPLTTNLKRLTMQPTVMLHAGEGGLPQDSVVLCYQIQVRGKARVISRLGKLAPERFLQVQGGVLNALGL